MKRIVLKGKNQSRIPVLMYHEVSEIPESKREIRLMRPNYALSVRQFKEQMEYLFQNNYRSLSLNSLFNQDNTYGKGVIITFDDGLIGNYDHVFAILKDYNFTATIFVIVSQVTTERYMNWEQLSELSNNGISIQSHTMTHRPLEQLSDEEVFYELSESKKIIEDKIGQVVNYLSLPHGSFHTNLVDIAKEVGYSGICSSTFGYVRPKNGQFNIGRIPIKDGHQIKDFKQIISENRMRLIKYKLYLLIANSLSNMLGINNYRKIYRFIFRIKL